MTGERVYVQPPDIPAEPPTWLSLLELAQLFYRDAGAASVRAVTFSELGEMALAERALGLAEGLDFAARCLRSMYAEAPR